MIKFESIKEKHRKKVIDIFNYYVEKTNYAYPQNPVDYSFFDVILKNAKLLYGYVVLDAQNQIIGFCELKPYKPISTFSKVAEVTYFLEHSAIGKSIGLIILKKLIQDAKKDGIEHLIASISGDNEISIKFHKKNNFIECGKFNNIGEKFGKKFDILYMMKEI